MNMCGFFGSRVCDGLTHDEHEMPQQLRTASVHSKLSGSVATSLASQAQHEQHGDEGFHWYLPVNSLSGGPISEPSAAKAIVPFGAVCCVSCSVFWARRTGGAKVGTRAAERARRGRKSCSSFGFRAESQERVPPHRSVAWPCQNAVG